jgi:putative transcriptional regulator
MKDMGDRSGHTPSLAPTLLVSMPQLMDPNFARTVVLLCEHNPDGAFGLVLNRPSETEVAEAVKLTPPPASNSGVRLWVGGPVEPQRGWILLGSHPDDAEAVELLEGLFLTSSPAVLRRLIETGVERSRVLTGYAGWAAGQLDAELAASAWLTANVDLDLVFEIPASEMWETAIRRLGADPALLQMGQGVH